MVGCYYSKNWIKLTQMQTSPLVFANLTFQPYFNSISGRDFLTKHDWPVLIIHSRDYTSIKISRRELINQGKSKHEQNNPTNPEDNKVPGLF